jgi:hypothetical protein
MSRKPNIRKIFRNILSQVGFVAPEHTNMEMWEQDEAISTLQNILTGKRYIRISDLTFEAGAMPKLRKLEVRYNEQYGTAPVGIKHLSGLTEFSVSNGGYNAEEYSRSVSRTAFRNAMDMHPCRPAAKINPCGNSQFLRRFDDDGFSWRKYGMKNVIGARGGARI